jgi:HK97 family phage portal protein
MNIFRRTASAIGRVFRSNAQLGSLPGAIAQWFGDHDGGLNASGESINYRTALHISTVFTCVRVISESVASLPLLLMEEVGNGHEEATDQRLHYLLSVEPNPNMSAFSLIECMCVSLCLAGNAYVEIERNDAGQPIALWPLHPRHTEPIIRADGSLIYETRDGASGAKRYILKEDILHVPLFSFDGVKGFDPITLLRQSLGMAKAAERQGALFFANNSAPLGGLLTNDEDMDPRSEQEFRESWEETQGAMRKGRIGVLTGKWKYQSIGLTAEQAQYLQTRAFQRTEIAAIYRLAPNQVGDTTRQSNSNKVQENLSFVVDTLRPYLTRIEIEVRRKLLPQVGRKAGKYIVRFDISERLRGDFLTTQQGYALGRQWGYYSGNDVRRAEGMNIGGPELDVYWYPVNMANAKNLLGNGDANLEQVKSSIRHLIPQWSAAFNTAGELNVRDYTLFRSAFTPVYTAIFDVFNGNPEVDASVLIDPVIRSLYRRSETWPGVKEPEFQDIAMTELTRSAQQLFEQVTRKKAA